MQYLHAVTGAVTNTFQNIGTIDLSAIKSALTAKNLMAQGNRLTGAIKAHAAQTSGVGVFALGTGFTLNRMNNFWRVNPKAEKQATKDREALEQINEILATGIAPVAEADGVEAQPGLPALVELQGQNYVVVADAKAGNVIQTLEKLESEIQQLQKSATEGGSKLGQELATLKAAMQEKIDQHSKMLERTKEDVKLAATEARAKLQGKLDAVAARTAELGRREQRDITAVISYIDDKILRDQELEQQEGEAAPAVPFCKLESGAQVNTRIQELQTRLNGLTVGGARNLAEEAAFQVFDRALDGVKTAVSNLPTNIAALKTALEDANTACEAPRWAYVQAVQADNVNVAAAADGDDVTAYAADRKAGFNIFNIEVNVAGAEVKLGALVQDQVNELTADQFDAMMQQVHDIANANANGDPLPIANLAINKGAVELVHTNYRAAETALSDAQALWTTAVGNADSGLTGLSTKLDTLAETFGVNLPAGQLDAIRGRIAADEALDVADDNFNADVAKRALQDYLAEFEQLRGVVAVKAQKDPVFAVGGADAEPPFGRIELKDNQGNPYPNPAVDGENLKTDILEVLERCHHDAAIVDGHLELDQKIPDRVATVNNGKLNDLPETNDEERAAAAAAKVDTRWTDFLTPITTPATDTAAEVRGNLYQSVKVDEGATNPAEDNNPALHTGSVHKELTAKLAEISQKQANLKSVRGNWAMPFVIGTILALGVAFSPQLYRLGAPHANRLYQRMFRQMPKTPTT